MLLGCVEVLFFVVTYILTLYFSSEACVDGAESTARAHPCRNAWILGHAKSNNFSCIDKLILVVFLTAMTRVIKMS